MLQKLQVERKSFRQNKETIKKSKEKHYLAKKEAVNIADLAKKIKETLDDIQSSLFQASKKLTEDNIVKTGNWNELTKAIENKKLVLAPSCGTPECEDLVKDKTGGAKALNIPFDQPKSISKCIHCGKEGKYLVYFGKSY